VRVTASNAACDAATTPSVKRESAKRVRSGGDTSRPPYSDRTTIAPVFARRAAAPPMRWSFSRCVWTTSKRRSPRIAVRRRRSRQPFSGSKCLRKRRSVSTGRPAAIACFWTKFSRSSYGQRPHANVTS
jgi:hypothetical protein